MIVNIDSISVENVFALNYDVNHKDYHYSEQTKEKIKEGYNEGEKNNNKIWSN